MTDLTIQELKNRKNILDNNISKLLMEFQKETLIKIVSIDLQIDRVISGVDFYRCYVGIKI